MTPEDSICPVCSTGLHSAHSMKGDCYEYNCAVCGLFAISRTAEVNLKRNPLGHKLSAWIREHSEHGRERPKITTYLLDDIAKSLPNYSPLEKQLLMLRAIERRTEYPGAEVSLKPNYDYPIAWANNPDEIRYLLNTLEERGFIKQQKTIEGLIQSAVILMAGWEYLDKHISAPAFMNQVFVAMSFDNALDPAWDNGIKPAIERAGYKAYRVDKEPHIDRIDAKIIADIKDSLFMVADVTQQRQGVYFEAGYALGLKLPVIWCVREDDLNKVHFDTRQYNHIVWKTPEDLQEQLYNLICAVIGKRKSSHVVE